MPEAPVDGVRDSDPGVLPNDGLLTCALPSGVESVGFLTGLALVADGKNGLEKDQECSRSSPKEWQPIRKKTLALWRTKSNSVFSAISLVPLAVCSDFDLRCWNRRSRLGSSFSGFPTANWLAIDADHTTAMSVMGDCSAISPVPRFAEFTHDENSDT
jgi:hypothetical protein